MNTDFSVLMSMYIKEKPEYFEECMKSILNQTVFPNEIVIVLDGPITDELNASLERYISDYPGLIKTVPLPENVGLGRALAAGVPECSFELIARMDTDDICRPDRFERQLEVFSENPDIDICGSHIIEFEGSPENELARRNVPLTHSEIARYQRQRSAFNHVTVMFKKSAVLRAGNYKHAPLLEDDVMWIDMIRTGSKCMNIDDYLVFVRTGYAMIERRGGFKYLRIYRRGRRQILKTGYISYWDYLKTMAVQTVIALMPKKLRLWVFCKLLRK